MRKIRGWSSSYRHQLCGLTVKEGRDGKIVNALDERPHLCFGLDEILSVKTAQNHSDSKHDLDAGERQGVRKIIEWFLIETRALPKRDPRRTLPIAVRRKIVASIPTEWYQSAKRSDDKEETKTIQRLDRDRNRRSG